tara:strand:+ start:216 stop:1301 length:1086 start_codon:yes stop_codon:yes gene_type:complete
LKKIAIVGTNGLPAKYGGFETLVEYLVKYLSSQFKITVFCSAVTCNTKLKEYNGCKLEYINLKANGWQSVFFDLLSIFKSRNFDKIIILGASGGVFMPFFSKFKNKFILNFGGLDWQRSKWNYPTRKFLKISEHYSIKYSKYIIADNKGIQEYIGSEYGRNSNLIAYGGDQSFKVKPTLKDCEDYPFLNNNYAFTVARIQSDNNIELILNSFSVQDRLPIVFVGNWDNSNYGNKIKKRYSNKKNVILLDAIYDPRILNLIRSNCKIYIHGHSAGGTNPALIEAMNIQLPIFTFDCIFNRYTTKNKAKYFSSSNELSILLNNLNTEDLKKISNKMLKISNRRYKWEKIAHAYSKVINESSIC